MRRALSILTVVGLLGAGCGDGGGGGTGDAGLDTATSADAADETPEPLLNLPRPLDWALGIWTGTMPAESTPGTAAVVAGKTVRLQITAPGSAVPAPDEGRYYAGQLTWDAGSAGQWSVSFDATGLGSSFARWVYDPDLHTETWDIAGVPDGTRSIDLTTTYIGTAGERPTEMVLDWAVRDTSTNLDETNGAAISTRLHLKKQ